MLYNADDCPTVLKSKSLNYQWPFDFSKDARVHWPHRCGLDRLGPVRRGRGRRSGADVRRSYPSFEENEENDARSQQGQDSGPATVFNL